MQCTLSSFMQCIYIGLVSASSFNTTLITFSSGVTLGNVTYGDLGAPNTANYIHTPSQIHYPVDLARNASNIPTPRMNTSEDIYYQNGQGSNWLRSMPIRVLKKGPASNRSGEHREAFVKETGALSWNTTWPITDLEQEMTLPRNTTGPLTDLEQEMNESPQAPPVHSRQRRSATTGGDIEVYHHKNVHITAQAVLDKNIDGILISLDESLQDRGLVYPAIRDIIRRVFHSGTVPGESRKLIATKLYNYVFKSATLKRIIQYESYSRYSSMLSSQFISLTQYDRAEAYAKAILAGEKRVDKSGRALLNKVAIARITLSLVEGDSKGQDPALAPYTLTRLQASYKHYNKAENAVLPDLE